MMLIRPLQIEAVIVCVDYGDFLRETLPLNAEILDHITVVTRPEDQTTRTICQRHNVRCLPTDVFYRDDLDNPAAKLNKSRGINHGLMHLTGDHWVMHLDADIVLPPAFRRIAMNCDLDPACIYGMDRVDCDDPDAWDRYLPERHTQFDWGWRVSAPKQFPLGSRLAHGDYGGWAPLGFMQLWNPKGSGVRRYPITNQGDMEHTDLLHALQWDRRKRVLMPEGYCVHLCTNQFMGQNWQGRKSPLWRGRRADASRGPESNSPGYGS